MRVRQHTPRRLTSRAVVLPLVALAALTTLACNLDKLTKPPLNAQTELNPSVEGDTTLAMGATVSLWVNSTKGGLGDAGAITFSSDAPAIAAVTEWGEVTGVSIGTANISAKIIGPELGEITAKPLKIRVKYAGISIRAVDSLIAIGMTKVIDVRGTNPAGTALASIPFSAAMTVVSRDPTIFDVNANGALVAKKNGSARVFVQYDGLKDSVVVKVRQVTRAITYVGAVAGELPVGSLNKDRTIAITAADSLGVAIAAPTVTWATSDLTTMTIGAATGVARALKLGTVTITATSDGFQKTILARVTQIPAALTKTAATDGLSATVNSAVALAPEVTVVDSGSTPIPSVAVTFTVATGGGSVTGGTQTSATTGKAAATGWVLGTVAGANTVVVSAGNASATFTATGVAGAPKKLGFNVQPTNAAVGAVIAPAIKVSVLDSLDNLTTSTSSITIAVGSGTGTLGGTLTASAVAGVATFSNITLNTAGSFTLVATTSTLLSATSNSFGIYGAATKLGFTTQPIGGTASQVLQPIRVAVQDAGGNTVTSDTRSITIAITAATGTSGAVLGGTLTATAVAGVATFSSITVDRAGTAYKLTGTTTVASALTAATSNTFDIAAVGPAAKLAFTVQPANTVAGATITPGIQVTVQDAGGATVTSSTAPITLAIETNPGSGTLAGTVTVNASAGIATFSTVNINKVGTAYKLNATSTGLTRAVSSTFNISAGVATKVGYIVAPSNAVAGAVIAPSIQVAIQDANSNTVTTSIANVTLTIGAGPGGSTLGGTTTIAAVAGIASFNNITLTPAATSYQLTASSPSITSATSPTFIITASATSAIKLGFLTQPSNVASNTSIAPSIQVAVQDANGATVTSSNASITLALSSNSGGAVASGVLTASASSGVATFTNAQVGLAGTGYTLVATAPAAGLTAATSTAFNVTPGAANRLSFVSQPTNEIAGTPFAPDVQVAVLDAFGNTVTTATNVVTLGFNSNPGGGSLRGTTSIAAVAGVATFTGARVTKTGAGYALFATSGGLNPTTSTSFDVTAAPASALAFKTQPANAVAGALQPSPFIQVAVVDSLANVITTANDVISLAANNFPTNGAMIGTSPITAVNGVATFSDVKFNVSGFYTLAATATNLATVTSNGLFITPGPAAALVWIANPAATGNVKGGAILANASNRLEVDIVDAFGNRITSDNSTVVTISIGVPGAGPGGGTLSGTNGLGAAFGQVFFENLLINSSGTGYKLTASSGALTAGTSTAFDIAAFGSPSKWVFQQQPTATVAGAAFSPVITVALQDAVGNIVTTTPTSNTAALSYMSNSYGVFPSGTITNVALSNGIATFNGVSMNGTGDGIQLVAFGGTGISNATSPAFNVAATTNAGGIYDIAVSGSNAFYFDRTGTATIRQVHLGTGLVTNLSSSRNTPGGIVTDGSYVYWIEDAAGAANSSFVFRVPVGGGTAVQISAAMTNAAPILQLDAAGNLYFIANNTASTNSEIKKIASAASAGAGTVPTVIYTTSCGTTCVPVFTISGTTMYFWDGVTPTPAIRSVSTAGGASTPIVSGVTGPIKDIAVSSSTIYWATSTSIFSASISTSSTAGTAKINNASNFIRLAFDGTSLFALDQGFTVIRKVNVGDFSSVSLVTGVSNITRAMAFDSSTIFWTDNSTPSKLRRTVK